MVKMNNVRWALLALMLAGLVLAGCDTTDDPEDQTDAELFVGTWEGVSATTSALPGVDLLTFLQADFTATLESSGAYQLTFATATAEGGFDVSGSGYTVDEAANTITFPPTGALTTPVIMNYSFSNNGDTNTLSFDGSVLAELGLDLPIDLTGQTVTLEIERQ